MNMGKERRVVLALGRVALSSRLLPKTYPYEPRPSYTC
jgi:hypothetical protein